MIKRRLTMGSLFDGSAGFPLASVLAGIEPLWASEIEPFPIRVTTKRLPNMKHYGDVSAISGAEDGYETWARDEKSNTLNTFDLGDTRTSEVIVYNNHPNDSRVTGTSGGVLDTLSSRMGTGGNNTPLVAAVDCNVKSMYVVRRLMPIEACRLQGFPDWWCADLDTPNPTEEEVAFWEDVFETHRRIVTQSIKPKSRTQIVKWLQHPHSDAAEYKMWGNGVALPCVYNVMKNIADELQEDET